MGAKPGDNEVCWRLASQYRITSKRPARGLAEILRGGTDREQCAVTGTCAHVSKLFVPSSPSLPDSLAVCGMAIPRPEFDMHYKLRAKLGLTAAGFGESESSLPRFRGSTVPESGT